MIKQAILVDFTFFYFNSTGFNHYIFIDVSIFREIIFFLSFHNEENFRQVLNDKEEQKKNTWSSLAPPLLALNLVHRISDGSCVPP